MIDISTEDLITLAVAARSLPGGAVHVSTCHRWRLKGCRGVKLETILRGGIRYTSRQAITRFFERSTAAADGGDPTVRTSRQREASVSAAEKRLEAAGI